MNSASRSFISCEIPGHRTALRETFVYCHQSNCRTFNVDDDSNDNNYDDDGDDDDGNDSFDVGDDDDDVGDDGGDDDDYDGNVDDGNVDDGNDNGNGDDDDDDDDGNDEDIQIFDWDGHEISCFGGLPGELYFPKGLYFPEACSAEGKYNYLGTTDT